MEQLSRQDLHAANRELMAVPIAALCWLWFFRGTLGWLFRALSDRSSLNPILLLCATGVAIYAARLYSTAGRARLLLRLRRGPRDEPLTLVFAFAMALLAFIVHRQLNVHTLGAVLFAVGSYALLRLYLPPAQWRRGVPLLLLLLLLLPVQDHLDAFVGFPLRVATARSVQELFAILHIPVRSAETILVLESGIANVDSPCSGVKSLWSGAIFYFAATWLFQKRLRIAWLGIGALYALLLLCSNALRVFILVFLLFVVDEKSLAQSLHVPLGILGFVGACAVAIFLLRRLPGANPQASDFDAESIALPAAGLSRRTLFSFAAGLLFLSVLTPRSTPHIAHIEPPLPALSLPSELAVEELPLTAGEQSLFFQHGGVMARKWRFAQGSHKGSLLIVMSRSFRAHHPPEVCLAASGLRVDGMARARIAQPGAAAFSVRQLSIEAGARSAFYWFQSRDRTTDSLLLRTLDDFRLARRPWVLMSVLFDDAQGPDSAFVQGFLIRLHAAVSTFLQGVS